jgi:hypothetical protein
LKTAVERVLDADAGDAAGLAKSVAAAEKEDQQQIEDRLMAQVDRAQIGFATLAPIDIVFYATGHATERDERVSGRRVFPAG